VPTVLVVVNLICVGIVGWLGGMFARESGRHALWGLLFGGAFFFIPAIGPLVVMGPFVGLIINGLEGAGVGGAAGALLAALDSVGIPSESVLHYEREVKAGKFLVLTRGTSRDVEHARALLMKTGATRLEAHAVVPTEPKGRSTLFSGT